MKISYKHENGFTHNQRVFCEVYCEVENETFDEMLGLGWNPSLEDENIWYQSRSCRINVDNHVFSSRRKSFISKLNLEIFDYENQKDIDDYFFDFFIRKNYEIKDLYQNTSNFYKMKVLKVSLNNEFLGYARYVENKESNLFMNLSYSENHSKLSLGTTMFHILSDLTKSQGKRYLYIYECYDNLYSYKQDFSGVEIWNGRKWETNEKREF